MNINVVRNLVMVVGSAALVTAGLFFTVVAPPAPPPDNGTTPPNPPNPEFPAGSQLAYGSPNGVTPPAGTTTPTTGSDFTGGTQSFVDGLPSDFPSNYASQSAIALQSFIDTQRSSAAVAALTYDQNLGTVAANLISDTIATNGNLTATGGVNSLGQTPIQQVQAQFPTSTAVYVSVLGDISDVLNANEATSPQEGLKAPEANFQVDPILTNAGWTHYGLAVVVTPAVQGQTNARRYYVIFFAKE